MLFGVAEYYRGEDDFMNSLVYRLTDSNSFVYCKIQFSIRNVVCGVQNIHKRCCGAYFQLQYPQGRFSRLSCCSRLNSLSVCSVYSVVKVGGRS